MNFIVLTDYYHPIVKSGSIIVGDLVNELSLQGHKITIVTFVDNQSKAAKRKKISKIITLTGNKKNTPLSKVGDINLWVNSNIYNYIENIHQIWLLTISDLISLNKVK